jgi:hypothetical protein
MAPTKFRRVVADIQGSHHLWAISRFSLNPDVQAILLTIASSLRQIAPHEESMEVLKPIRDILQ